MSKIANKLALIGLGAALMTAPLHGMPLPHPNHERGFDVGEAFRIGEIDSVAVMNGNLVLTIPLGQEYPVAAGLGYRLSLVWNANHWDFDVFRDDDPTTAEIEHTTQAWPHEGFTAGLGWNLSLGRLLPPVSDLNDSIQWVYVSRDGANHPLFPTLHVGEPADAAFYSRDGSYLRMMSSGTFRVVEFPDGTRHSFEPEPIGDYYRLARIDDPHGNFVTVTYGATGWRISDSHGRSQFVELIDHDPLDDWEPKVVSRVELEAFDGTTAVYQLRYTTTDIVRECPNNDAELKKPLGIPVLSEVELPDGSKYVMPDYVMPSTNLLCGNQAGRILALDLPTGGRLEWTYQNYSFPRLEGPTSPPPAATQAFETSIGVATRSLIDTDGTVLGTWTYDPVLTPNLDGGGPGVPQPNEMVNTVTDPLGNVTQNFFSLDLDGFAFTGDWSVYDYGLPFTRDPATILPGSSPAPEDDLLLSTRAFDSAGALLRSTYVRYEKDVPGTALNVAQTQNMNRRLVAERRVYHDDTARFSERLLSSYDGVGHYQTLVETGDFEGSPSKTTTTNYNPGRDYEVDDAGNLVGSYAMIAASEPWVLNTYDYQSVSLSEGTYSETSRVETTFIPETGFLECRRVLKGTSRGADDVLVVFTDADGDGNVDQEAFYGGDLQSSWNHRGNSAMDELRKMRVELSDTWHGHSAELLWVEGRGFNQYRVMNTPFHAFELSFYDIVVAEEGEDGMLEFSEVSMRGGHSTYRLMLQVAPTAPGFVRFWQPLQEDGCSFEGKDRKLLAVDVPPEADIYKVYALLETGEEAGVWEFEEGHCGHLLKGGN